VGGKKRKGLPEKKSPSTPFTQGKKRVLSAKKKVEGGKLAPKAKKRGGKSALLRLE